jgi:hypothetical protein
MSIGFAFAETMRGNYYLLADPTDERAMSFTLRASSKGFRSFAHDPVARIEGRVAIEGFADDAPFEGNLAFRFGQQRRLTYDFTFVGNDAKPYRFRGQKDLTPLAIVESFTTLSGSLYDEGKREIGRATLRFDLRSDIHKLLRSFRLVY